MVADARTALFIAMISVALTGCTFADNARGLDRICGKHINGSVSCAIEGIGTRDTGLTEDSTGFTLHDASLVVRLDATDELHAPGPFDISLLTLPRLPGTQLDTALTWGSCLEGCPPDPPPTSLILPSGYAWVTVASGIHGSTPDATLTYDAVMTFTALEIDIVDLRISATP